ncbi:hypothetical protein GCM10027037_15370 [Mucilaginibacter koreensis]
MMKLKRSALHKMLITFFGLTAIGAAISSGCNSPSGSVKMEALNGDVKHDGAVLVQHYCAGSCHQLVPANALTKAVWINHILPDMAKYLHLANYAGGYFKPDTAASGISLTDWDKIVTYYNTVAPDSLPKAKPPVPLVHDWAGFSLRLPAKADSVPYTTMVSVNPYTQKIYSSDLESRKLLEWGAPLQPHEVTELPSTAMQALFTKDNQAILASVGVIELADYPNGRLTQVDLNGARPAQPQVIGTDLPRPVFTATGDLNKDGLQDYIVCGQGGSTGGLFWLKQTATHQFEKVQLTTQPGAVQATVGDYNNDGWPDIMALFGAKNEGLFLFTNNHAGGFAVKQLLKVPPVYGLSSFQLADMNHDGKLDVVVTAGYNFRNSRILKPYHGMYIFNNQGNWKLKQSYFYPVNGCTKAIAADMDGDGDLDITTIAFFADMLNNPAEELLYFEQDSSLHFKPHALPVNQYGRWMSMDVNDVNHDGKPDIVLGNYSHGYIFQEGLKPNWGDRYPLIVLVNHCY